MNKTNKNNRQPNHLLQEDNALLLDHIRTIHDKFQDKLGQLSILRELGNIIVYINDFKRICQTIMDVTINNSVARNCSIMLMDFEQDKLFLVAATNPDGNRYIIDVRQIFSKEDLRYTFSYGEGVAGEVLRSKKPALIDDVAESEVFNTQKDTKVPIGTLLSVPLIIEDSACGVITLSHPEKHIFDSSDVHLFTIVANIVALALNSALSYESLKYSEEKYRALSEYSNDGITIIQDGIHKYANPSYKSMTGYTFKELQEIPLETLIPSNDNKTADLKRTLFENNLPGTFETVLKTRTGKNLDVEISHASFLHMGSHAKILSVRDLRERKELELKLQQARKMEALGVIAGGVAHDLNNILSGITSYPELLLMDLPADSPLIKPLTTIKKSGEKAIATVQDLLTLARRGVSVMEVVNLNNLIEEYLKSPEHNEIKSHHKSVEIQSKFEAEELYIMGSPYHLNKTILNLILNAAEAMPDGGTISIITENCYIDKPIQCYEIIEEGDYVMLSVSDNASGIPAADMVKLFEPFYTKKMLGRSGTGLGLPVVWGTVKDHKGFIDVISKEGKGTTFRLYFPVTREEISRGKHLLSIDEYRGNGESVLVVDDVLEQREIASMMLEKLGYHVTSVSSGEEAVEHVTGNPVDLLILDMIMDPGIDGLETYKRILKIHSGQKAIITSGFSETERAKKVQELGAAGYIKKPYSLEKIGVAVRKALDT
jgi:two-component system cell cycle sensor histidine kinase/response regulator CckA